MGAQQTGWEGTSAGALGPMRPSHGALTPASHTAGTQAPGEGIEGVEARRTKGLKRQWERAADALGGDAESRGDDPSVGEEPLKKRRFGFMVGMRCHFGGAHMPQRFGRVSTWRRVVTRKRQREFDARHPWPECAQQNIKRRRILQNAGLLPAGEEQREPADVQSFIE